MKIFLDLLSPVERSITALTAEEWSAYEQAYARLAAKVRAGETYRLPTIIERLGIEDAFKSLGLDIKSATSWDRIEAARAFRESAATSADAAKKVNLAARYLKVYLAEVPNMRVREFVPISKAERALLKTLGRSPILDQFWEDFAAQQDENLHLNVPVTPPAINAPGSQGVRN